MRMVPKISQDTLAEMVAHAFASELLPEQDTQTMPTDYVKTALMGVWILAVGVLGYVLGATSFVGWTVLVAMALTPPVVMMRLWRAPSQSMSESIREALR